MRAYDLGRGAYYIKHVLRKPTRLLVGKSWWVTWYWEGQGSQVVRHRRLLREVQGALIYLWHDRVLGRRQRGVAVRWIRRRLRVNRSTKEVQPES